MKLHMGNTGKISVIPKEFSNTITQESSLRRQGYNFFPGTRKIIFPYKELDGTYRTGLDENSSTLNKIPEPIRTSEKERIKKTRLELEAKLRISLAPDSSYYKFTSNAEVKVAPYGLKDGDNLFNLDDPFQAVTYYWLKAHPTIAPSYEAYLRGEVSPDTQFFVNDEEVESRIEYAKNKELNDAVATLNSLSIERKKKIANLVGLPYGEDAKEEVIYNGLNKFIKSGEIKEGGNIGASPIKLFNMYASLEPNSLDVRDLVESAFKYNIYRTKKGGKVYEGENFSWESKDAMIEHLLDETNQADRLELEKKLKIKRLQAI